MATNPTPTHRYFGDAGESEACTSHPPRTTKYRVPMATQPTLRYFGVAGESEVRTNLEVNALDEWDVTKLGWYKIRESGRREFDAQQVRQAFDVNVRAAV